MSSTTLNAAVASQPSHPLKEFWRYFKGNKGALAGLAIVVLVLLMALARELQGPVQRLFEAAFQAARALTA